MAYEDKDPFESPSRWEKLKEAAGWPLIVLILGLFGWALDFGDRIPPDPNRTLVERLLGLLPSATTLFVIGAALLGWSYHGVRANYAIERIRKTGRDRIRKVEDTDTDLALTRLLLRVPLLLLDGEVKAAAFFYRHYPEFLEGVAPRDVARQYDGMLPGMQPTAKPVMRADILHAVAWLEELELLSPASAADGERIIRITDKGKRVRVKLEILER